jgi:hypothetical protein
LDNSTWEIVRPKYEIALVSAEAQWFYFEGLFWGQFQEKANSDCKEKHLLDYIDKQDQQLGSYEVILRGLRWEFTHGGANERL